MNGLSTTLLRIKLYTYNVIINIFIGITSSGNISSLKFFFRDSYLSHTSKSTFDSVSTYSVFREIFFSKSVFRIITYQKCV